MTQVSFQCVHSLLGKHEIDENKLSLPRGRRNSVDPGPPASSWRSQGLDRLLKVSLVDGYEVIGQTCLPRSDSMCMANSCGTGAERSRQRYHPESLSTQVEHSVLIDPAFLHAEDG